MVMFVFISCFDEFFGIRDLVKLVYQSVDPDLYLELRVFIFFW